jgi:hypothetical protein
MRAIVDLPAPLGLDSTNSSPRLFSWNPSVIQRY